MVLSVITSFPLAFSLEEGGGGEDGERERTTERETQTDTQTTKKKKEKQIPYFLLLSPPPLIRAPTFLRERVFLTKPSFLKNIVI